MPLQLIEPRERYMMHSMVIPEAVMSHLRTVLMKYLADPAYSKFYVGITQDVDRRLDEHRRTKPEYKLMIPICQDKAVRHAERFDQLEQLAIQTFGPGNGTAFTHPNAPPGRKLLFDNRRENSQPQNILYLLVG